VCSRVQELCFIARFQVVFLFSFSLTGWGPRPRPAQSAGGPASVASPGENRPPNSARTRTIKKGCGSVLPAEISGPGALLRVPEVWGKLWALGGPFLIHVAVLWEVVFNFLRIEHRPFLEVWEAPGAPETLPKGGGLRPPPFARVSGGPGAAQTPKMTDFRLLTNYKILQPSNVQPRSEGWLSAGSALGWKGTASSVKHHRVPQARSRIGRQPRSRRGAVGGA
jgi:hypothetical protein